MQVAQPKFRTKRLVTAIATALAISPLLVACGGGGGGSTTYSFSANGGHAVTGDAGDGGEIRLNKDGGNGDLAILRTGKASASVSINEPTLDLGSNPLLISSNTTIEGAFDGGVRDGVRYYIDDTTLRDANNADPDTNELPEGTLYIRSSDDRIYRYTGDTFVDTPYTGLDVAAGATLTLGLIHHSGTWVAFEDDVRNRGSITVVDTAIARGRISIDANNYFGSGSVSTSGTSNRPDAGAVEITLTGGFYNTGPISATGFNNPAGDGSDGSFIYIHAEGGPVVNSGVMDIRGGIGSTNGGGDYFNYIDLYGYDVVNSAALYTQGGDGGGNGGDGAWVYFNASERYSDGSGGVVYNTGTVNAQGGQGSNGSGGNAGGVYVYGYGGHIVNTASLHLNGGDGTLGAGGGGGMDFFSYKDGETPAGDILISGNINLNGGSSSESGFGGDAGDLYIYADNGDLPGTQRLALLGYPNVHLDGGSTDSGWSGQGGEVSLYGDSAFDFASGQNIAGGDVVNQANIYARAGDSADGSTQQGGRFAMFTNYGTDNIGMHIHNSGDIDLSSGQSSTPGIDPNFGSWMGAMSGLTNTGSITVRGGNNTGTGAGSQGGYVSLWSVGPLSNTARLDVSGGQGTDGGDAGWIFLATRDDSGQGPGGVTTSGGAYALGGDATGASGTGGAGGDIEYNSDFYGNSDPAVTTTYSGVQAISGGAGDVAGTDGCLTVDEVDIAGSCVVPPLDL